MPEYLEAVSKAHKALETARQELTKAVLLAHVSGHSWREIAEILGTTKQAVAFKYSKLQDDKLAEFRTWLLDQNK